MDICMYGLHVVNSTENWCVNRMDRVVLNAFFENGETNLFMENKTAQNDVYRTHFCIRLFGESGLTVENINVKLSNNVK